MTLRASMRMRDNVCGSHGRRPDGWECYFCSYLNALFTYKCFGCGALRTNGA